MAALPYPAVVLRVEGAALPVPPAGPPAPISRIPVGRRPISWQYANPEDR